MYSWVFIVGCLLAIAANAQTDEPTTSHLNLSPTHDISDNSAPNLTFNKDQNELPEATELWARPGLLKPIDLTADYDDIWDRIRAGFSMPDLDNDLVRQQQIWYINRPDYLRRVIERSRRYMHFIIEEIDKRGMPTELALLPIVESAYNPMAYSPAKASGLWQFIPSTGRQYKLDQNWWVDERRDIIASTGAALDYLKYIYELHGDWQLALASYNWGEGSVGRAIAKNRSKGLPTDYSSLSMPKETQHYVPKLQALKNIISNQNLWVMLDIEGIPNKAYFSTVQYQNNIDVKVAAKLAEMPLSEFVALNPAHSRPVIKANFPLVLPADKIEIFNTNLEQNNTPLSHWQSYSFQKTDRLDRVAARFGISLSQLKTVNGIDGKWGRVLPGRSLLVPAQGIGDMDLQLASFEPPETIAPAPTPAKRQRKVTLRRQANASSAISKTKSGGKKYAGVPKKKNLAKTRRTGKRR